MVLQDTLKMFLMKSVARTIYKSIYIKVLLHIDNYVTYCGVEIQISGKN